jgi:hypothetical protein
MVAGIRDRGIVGMLALLAALALACGGGTDGLEGVDAQAQLEAAAERMDAVESFHFVMTQEHGTTSILLGLELVSAEGDVAGADHAQMEIAARLGPTNLRVSIIVLPDASYITNPLTGRWQQQDVSLDAFFNPEIGMTALMRVVTEPEVTRRERVGGVDAYLVESTVDSGDLDLFAPEAPPGQPLRARAWIGVDDPLVHRIEIEGAVMPGEDERTVRRLDLSRFDEPVDIVAPQ